MEFVHNGWAMFANEAAAFSGTFREEMAVQLLERFYLMMGIPNPGKQHKFHLQVGLLPLNTICQDGCGFAVVYIVSPDSVATPATAYWMPMNGEPPESASTTNVWNKDNIEFGWCADFDKNNYLTYVRPGSVLSKEQLGVPFDVEYNYSLFPDLSLTIRFDQKVFEDEILQIESMLAGEIKDTYISGLTNDDEVRESDEDNEIFGILDFQNNDVEIAKQQLIDALVKIGKSNLGNKIRRVTIE